jgi:hypothetical protein
VISDASQGSGDGTRHASLSWVHGTGEDLSQSSEQNTYYNRPFEKQKTTVYTTGSPGIGPIVKEKPAPSNPEFFTSETLVGRTGLVLP